MEILTDIFLYLVILIMILAVAYVCWRVEKLNELKREPVGKRVKVKKNGAMVTGKVALWFLTGEVLVITDRCGAVVSSVNDLEPLIFERNGL